jgi:CheY-like chemotaxis protein
MPYETTAQHLLLVDDNNLDIDLFERALQKTNANIKLDTARGGEQALEYIQKWEKGTALPVVVLLDLKMPKINGLEVLHALKSHPRFKTIPVVVLTSSNEMSDIRKAYELGVNSYIMKSVDYDEFARAVAMIHHYWCQLNIHPE